MTLRTLLLITIGLWLLLVTSLGYWRMFYAWHWGNGVTFFFHSLPLAALGLIVIVILEIIFFRPKHSSAAQNPGSTQKPL
jgi:hypothetical protein